MQKEKLTKTIKSELWNRLTYRDLSYILRLAVILSELAKTFRGHNLKIQHWTSFDLNGLKNGATKNLENSLKSMQIFQILMGGMNFIERSQKKQKRPQKWGM